MTNWAMLRHALPRARLVLMAPPGLHRQRLGEHLDARGIAPDRIPFLSSRPRAAYLRSYHGIDIGLDTLPYNGHTTSLDALWMDVPVITRIGEPCVGRAGFCQLNNIGLPELAANLGRLASLRRGFRARLSCSPLLDAARFARQIEAR